MEVKNDLAHLVQRITFSPLAVREMFLAHTGGSEGGLGRGWGGVSITPERGTEGLWDEPDPSLSTLLFFGEGLGSPLPSFHSSSTSSTSSSSLSSSSSSPLSSVRGSLPSQQSSPCAGREREQLIWKQVGYPNFHNFGSVRHHNGFEMKEPSWQRHLVHSFSLRMYEPVDLATPHVPAISLSIYYSLMMACFLCTKSSFDRMLWVHSNSFQMQMPHLESTPDLLPA